MEFRLRTVSEFPRIAMVSTHGYVAAHPPLGASDTGGQVVYVLELSKKLADLGYELDIWTRRFEDQPEIEPVSEQVRIIRVPCGGGKFIPKEYLYEHLREWTANALRFIDQHGLQYEFIDSHYWDAGIAAQVMSESLGVPHVHTPHSLGLWKKRQMEADYPGERARLEREYNFSNRICHERRIYSSADLILATSGTQKRLLLEDYQAPRSRCRMLPPGYNAERFFPVSQSCREAIRRRLGFVRPVVMAIGRLALNKGYDLLIRAFEFVARRLPEITLYLAVGGAKRDSSEEKLLTELRDLTLQLGLKDRIRFGNFVPDGELADYYRAADVFVLSSRYEPFGMTALEAMACGTPVVMTTQGGFHRAVRFGSHALYADPFDHEELGVMIMEIIRHARIRSALSRLGAQMARKRYAWSHIASRLQAMAGEVSRPKVCHSGAGCA